MEAIESILFQTYRYFEFILIDDGSTDNTLDIIKRYATQDCRIVVIEKKNTGLTDSLNLGIHIAQGEWIARMDADDVADPQRLSEQIFFLSQNPSIVLLGTSCIEINESGMPMKNYFYPTRHAYLLKRLERRMAFFPHSSAIYLKKTVKHLRGYNPRILKAQDCDLWLRIAEIGKIACLKKPYIRLRKHAQQISHEHGGRTLFLNAIVATVCHFLRLMDKNDPSQQDEELWHRFFEWIEVRMEQERVFEIKQKSAKLRERYISNHSHSRVSRMWKLVEGLAKSGDTFKILTRKIVGSNLPRKLAIEWVYYKKYCPQTKKRG